MLSEDPDLTAVTPSKFRLNRSAAPSPIPTDLVDRKYSARGVRVPPLRLNTLSRVPALNFKATQKKRLALDEADDLFFLEEYRKAEIPRSKKAFNWHFPFWFLSSEESPPSKSVEQLELKTAEFQQWAQDLLSQLGR